MQKYLQSIEKSKKIAKLYLESKLKKQLTLSFYIVIIIFLFGIYEAKLRDVNFWLVLFGFFLGLVIGFLAGRIFKIYWNTETEKVIYKLDRTGLFILVFYILINIIGEILFRKWIDKNEYLSFVLFFCSGLLLGRLFTLVKNIKKVLNEENRLEI